MDWLHRVYRFSSDEIDLAFDHSGFLSLEQDPKTVIAMENLDAFPIDLNAASREQLLRIPGVGPVSAGRILENRRRHTIDNWRDLQSMGVVRKRAWPYVVFPGQRPPSGRQLRMDLFGEAKDRRAARSRRSPPSAHQIAGPLHHHGVAEPTYQAGRTYDGHECIPGSKGAMCSACPSESHRGAGMTLV